MRRLRHLVNPSLGNKAVVEITGRTAGAQFLLKPDNQVNAIIAGVLARELEQAGSTKQHHSKSHNTSQWTIPRSHAIPPTTRAAPFFCGQEVVEAGTEKLN